MRRGREVRQLDIGYPDSPLSRELTGRSGTLRAGHRAPDAQISGAAGQPSRLFQLLRGPHWTLLVHGTGRETIGPSPGPHIHHIGRTEEHTSELQSLMRIPNAIFCLKTKPITSTK